METTQSDRTVKPLTFEERLAPKLSQAEYLLPLVIGLMLWNAGLVDLLTHTSQDGAVLGLYSIPFFGLIGLYALGFIFWFAMIFPANSLTWFRKGLSFIQARVWLGLALFAGFALVLASMLVWERWLAFPLLESSLALLILLASGMILVARPVAGVQVQPWRKVLLVVFGGMIAAEALLQGLSFAKILPGQNISGLFTHYGRVYQNGEGFANGRTNEHGFYYPPFELADGARRILVAGDTYVLGLQVRPEENLGAVLDRRFAAGQPGEDIEVLAVGLPGYGPGLYLDTLLIPYVIQPLSPEEVIVFFHLADDLQTADGPGGAVPYFILGADGAVEIHPDDFGLRHTLQHVIIRGFEPPNPVRTVSSHSFLFNFVDDLVRTVFGREHRVPAPATNTRQADQSNPFGASSFAFRSSGGEGAEQASAETAFAVAAGLLKAYHDQLAAEGIRMRLVTIPYFPSGFYTANSGPGWESRLGEYDLFLPELALADFAAENDIPFLPMGQVMQADGLAVEEIRALFYKDGAGRFTPAGHEYFAEMIYACFYSGGEGCPLQQ